MADLTIGPGDGLYYEYAEAGRTGKTFVFVNALTGDTAMWQATIAPALRAAGHGTLCYNLRGQQKSALAAATALTPGLIVQDLNRLLDHLSPARPLLVGLSIGGLFAAQAQLAKPRAEGLVLINTLRKPGIRLDWINRAMVEMAKLGGTRLVMAANLPMIVNPEQLPLMWDKAFGAGGFEAMGPDEALMRLVVCSTGADWDLPYEALDLPVLLMTGAHDRVFRVEADIAELAGRLPNAREERFEDAGHLIPLERPEAFTRHLVAFGAAL